MRVILRRTVWIAILSMLLSLMMGICHAVAIDQITVAYYPGWPCTYQVGQAKGWFEKELGIEFNFRPLDHPYQMATALSSGECHIAYSLGITPFTSGVSQGIPYLLIGIAVSYAENDNCVARNGTGIRSPRDLIGKRVGVPFESVSHYKLLATLKLFGVDKKQVKIYDMTPQDITSAMRWKGIDCGCAWEPAVSEMLQDGHLIVSAENQERWGMKVFDVIAANKHFAKENSELMTRFLTVVDDSTHFYRKHFEESSELIAKMAGISTEKAQNILRNMKFFTKEKQLSPAWLGMQRQPGEVVDYISKMAQFLLEEKAINKTLDNYGAVIDASFYEAVRQ